jgi:hypothetical protein
MAQVVEVEVCWQPHQLDGLLPAGGPPEVAAAQSAAEEHERVRRWASELGEVRSKVPGD